MNGPWETFYDVSYYHLWRIRRVGERSFDDGFHVLNQSDAEALLGILNGLERQLAEACEQRGRSIKLLGEIKETADYWSDAADACQCISPQPIGSCLACDMAGISIAIHEALEESRKDDA